MTPYIKPYTPHRVLALPCWKGILPLLALGCYIGVFFFFNVCFVVRFTFWVAVHTFCTGSIESWCGPSCVYAQGSSVMSIMFIIITIIITIIIVVIIIFRRFGVHVQERVVMFRKSVVVAPSLYSGVFPVLGWDVNQQTQAKGKGWRSSVWIHLGS